LAEIKDYQTIVGKENIDQLFRLARRLGKRKVIHVSSTNISERMLENYLENNEKNASILDLEADIVIVHDPQPASLIRSGKGRAKWIWRCHIDVSRPERRVWKFLKGFVSKYDASIFSMSKFAHNLPHPQYIIFPSIDPLSQKNRELSQKETDEIKRDFGINNLKPTILQISRFDRFKDPLGVMEAYRLVKRNTDCKLILAGGGAADDPEGFEVLTQVKEQKKGDPDIHLLFLPPTANREINALQRDADIVLQKSLKEGFGLTVTEAMWKKKPVIGGAVGGIVEQIFNYQTGFLVHSVEGAAYRIRYLLHHSNMARKMAENAKEYVRRRFLVTRHLRDYLSLFIALDHPQDDYISI